MNFDRLELMLKLQRNLQRDAYGLDPSHLSDIDKMEFIRSMILACTDELHEALNETGWKPWASSNHINMDAYKNELVDAWHFMMNLMIVVDMDADELHARYLEKREKNITRQKDGYDGLDKCPMCKRAYDDDAVDCSMISEFSGVPYINCVVYMGI